MTATDPLLSSLQQQQIQQAPSTESVLSLLKTKKAIITGILFLGILNIFLLVMIGILPNPFGNNILLTIGDKSITEKDVNSKLGQTWGGYTTAYKSDKTLKNKALESLTEQEIIMLEAEKMNITVSEDEIMQKEQEIITKVGSKEKYDEIMQGNGWTLQEQREKIKNDLFKEKVTTAVVAWRLVEYVGGSVNPGPTNFQALVQETTEKLQTARTYLLEGKTAEEAAQLVTDNFTTYPNIFYESTTRVTKDSRMNTLFIDEIFKYKRGEVTQVIGANTGAALVAHILDGNNGQYMSYEQWLEAMKKKYMKQ